MSPFKSSVGRSLGKLIEGFKSSTIGSGLAASGTRATSRIIASGGDATYEPGNGYKYHRFDGPGQFEILLGYNTVDILIVAGGGGGAGGYYGGGGGGGGVVFGSTFLGVESDGSAKTFIIGVGSGGSAGTGNGHGVSDPGQNSNFQSIFALGGGGGSSGPGGGNLIGDAGGSAGGSSYYNNPGVQDNTPQPVPQDFTGYGNPGGASRTPGTVGGGGGGAGTAGSGRDGGHGIEISGFEYPLVGLSPLNPKSATNNQYGGGGSGGPGGTGGAGGGASGSTAGIDGLGGGGAAPGGNGSTGGDGGSGIVIVRYGAS